MNALQTRYRAIVIDPPWSYERTVGQGVAHKQYSLMTWDDLYALGPLIHAVAAPDCAIFLWTCAPLLMETADLVRAWDFRYINKAFCWLKTYADGSYFVGLGAHTRGNTEDVWLLSNGTPKRNNSDVYRLCQPWRVSR
jgi:site-specific DNA-methyltransferase (adenine-specific)